MGKRISLFKAMGSKLKPFEVTVLYKNTRCFKVMARNGYHAEEIFWDLDDPEEIGEEETFESDIDSVVAL